MTSRLGVGDSEVGELGLEVVVGLEAAGGDLAVAEPGEAQAVDVVGEDAAVGVGGGLGNRYASAFAQATQASVTNIHDGGITGPAFFDHVARLRRPVLDSPKRHYATMPPALTRRPVQSPVPLWTWALLHRADDARPMVARATHTLIDHASAFGWRTPPSELYWPPPSPKKP